MRFAIITLCENPFIKITATLGRTILAHLVCLTGVCNMYHLGAIVAKRTRKRLQNHASIGPSIDLLFHRSSPDAGGLRAGLTPRALQIRCFQVFVPTRYAGICKRSASNRARFGATYTCRSSRRARAVATSSIRFGNTPHGHRKEDSVRKITLYFRIRYQPGAGRGGRAGPSAI